jgi:hypothetical protein
VGINIFTWAAVIMAFLTSFALLGGLYLGGQASITIKSTDFPAEVFYFLLAGAIISGIKGVVVLRKWAGERHG